MKTSLPRKIVSYALLAVGLFWAGFVILSHGNEPGPLLAEGLLVPGPFLLAAFLCRWWPRTVGVLLLALAAWTAYFFHVVTYDPQAARMAIDNIVVGLLVPLPLGIAGVVLLADRGNNAPTKVAT
jgi:hypothetical protein